MKLAVLLNENAKSADYWLKAAAQLGVDIETIDLFSKDWLEDLRCV